MQIKLEVYVDQACPGCDYARGLAEQVRERMPEVDVVVVDLSKPQANRPEEVFAVPTYLLDGKTLSLGNPGLEQLLGWLRERLPEN
jgi:hypothetical protein